LEVLVYQRLISCRPLRNCRHLSLRLRLVCLFVASLRRFLLLQSQPVETLDAVVQPAAGGIQVDARGLHVRVAE